MELCQCLVCSEHFNAPTEEETHSNLLGRQLKAVFVLRELLRLPPEKLAEFLGSSGGEHPDQWIRLCESCQSLVEGAFTHFQQMVQINGKLKRLQEKVVRRVKESGRILGSDALAEEARDFVKNHNYGSFGSRFLAGDCEAEWQLEMQRAAAPEQADEPETEVDNAGESNAKAFPCALCPLSYSNKMQRWRHVQERHKSQTPMLKYVDNQKPTPCPTCHKTCKGRVGLRFHEKTHQNLPRKPKPQEGGECPTCHKHFSWNRNLKEHVQRRSCRPEVQEDGSTVVRRVRARAPPRGKLPDGEVFLKEGQTLFRCRAENCGAVLKDVRGFLKHQSSHRRAAPADKWLTCEVCQGKFLRNIGLRTHQSLRHPELPPFQTRAPFPRAPADPSLKGWGRYLRPCPHCPYKGNRHMVQAHVNRVHQGDKAKQRQPKKALGAEKRSCDIVSVGKRLLLENIRKTRLGTATGNGGQRKTGLRNRLS